MQPAPPPALVFWETTAGCNLTCAHCRRLRAATGPLEDDLSTAEALDLIDQIASAGCRTLVFSGGEPLIRPDICDLIRHATQRRLFPALATNGTLIDGSLASKLAESGLKIAAVSIDGPDAETHDSLRGLAGCFDAAVRGIRNLQAAGISVQINTTVTRSNAHKIRDVYELAVGLGAVALHFFIFVPVGCGLRISQRAMLDADACEEILNWICDIAPSSPIRVKPTCAPHYRRICLQRVSAPQDPAQSHADEAASSFRGCLAGTGIAFVSHEGKVFPCGYLPVEAGDIRNQEFKEIWENSPLLNALRGDVALRGKCGVCEYKQVCLGCRARTYSATGDLFGPEPCCPYQPSRR